MPRHDFQRNHREEWLSCLRAAFNDLDRNQDGRVRADEIEALLREKLPEEEVRGRGGEGVDGAQRRRD